MTDALIQTRERQEEWEIQYLSSRAAKSRFSQGRERPRDEDPLRTAFQRDRDRILHSKAFRRLKDKTQVFIAPEGDHFRTRLTHTLEVMQVSRTIGRALRLNEDLIEAICLGHDLGHPPFAHTGEHALSRVVPGGFQHNLQSLRVVEVLEDMNLTLEVRDGIRNHTGSVRPRTLEGQIVKVADRIAYLNHDIDDALRAGILTVPDLGEFLDKIGPTHGDRIAYLVTDMVKHSAGQDLIQFSEETQKWMDDLRTFMFRRVYLNREAKREEAKAERIVRELYLYFSQNPEQLAKACGREVDPADASQMAVDYVAGMTDRYAINTYRDIYLPAPYPLD